MCGDGSRAARHGWGLSVVLKAGCKAGNKVGSAPWNIPTVGLGGDGETGPRGIFRRCDPLRGIGFCDGPEGEVKAWGCGPLL